MAKFFMLSIVGILLAAILRFAVHVIPASGLFAELEPVLVNQCTRVDVAPGTEDVEIDEATGQVFISTFDRRGWYTGNNNDQKSGAIYMLDLSDNTLTPRMVSEDAPADFAPHGISLWTEDDGSRRLFVVSHRSSGEEVIELFDIDDRGDLIHSESVMFTELYSPNDVVGVGNRSFYATNDRRYDEGLLGELESYLALPLTDVVYFDGVSGSVAARGLVYANGVSVSADGLSLFIAEPIKRRLSIFDRAPITGALTKTKTIRLNTAPDNIDVAPDGSLFIGGHPKIFDFIGHAEDEDTISPSHVIRVDPVTGEKDDVFIAIEGEINGSSVGAASDEFLIVGAVFDGHVMVCPLN